MIKLFICLCFLPTTILRSYGQSSADSNFSEQSIEDEIFNFTPMQRQGVTDQRFQYAQQIIINTISASKNNPKNLNAADYWNITTAFVILKEPTSHIQAAFKKAVHLDKATICSYIQMLGTSGLDTLIPENFLPVYADCMEIPPSGLPQINVQQYAQKNNLNADIVNVVNTIYLNDICFRMIKPVDWNKQKPLDEKNQWLVDSLFKVYKNYIGKSLVGKQLESTMWLVVQHSSLEMMERYLPVIATAVIEKQLNEMQLKMLIDRIYWLKYNYQVYGSQGTSIKLADEKTRNEIIKKYHLN